MRIAETSPVSALRRSIRRAPSLGVPFVLTLGYMIMEYVRPPNSMKIPLIISVSLFVSWAMLRHKRWSTQSICFLLLLSVIAITGPFVVNHYSAWWGFVAMTVQLVFICIPMMHFISSMRKMTIFIHVLIVISAYVALYGLLHEGQGPGAHLGDENDLALALNMAIPYAYFSLFAATRTTQKVFVLASLGLMVSAVIATFSRGGFIGLLAVLLYSFLASPRKGRALALVALLAGSALICAPDSYWNRIATIVDEAGEDATGTGALRREFWTTARAMFRENPVFGVGFKNFEWNVNQYETADQTARLGRSHAGHVAHSIYFSVLAELGLAGAVLFGAIVVCNVRDTGRVLRQCARWQRIRRSVNGRTPRGANDDSSRQVTAARYYAHAVRGSMLGYLVSGIFLSAFDYPHFWILTAVTVALKWATSEALTGVGAAQAPARWPVDRRVVPAPSPRDRP